MKKRWINLIGAAVCVVLLLFVVWQNTSSADLIWDTHETQCDESDCYGGYYKVEGSGDWDCVCTSGDTYATCEEVNLGWCTRVYECTQVNCQGTCYLIGESSSEWCRTTY